MAMSNKERLEFAQARAKKKGKTAVQTPEGISEKTPQELAVEKGIENAKINQLIAEALKTPPTPEAVNLAGKVGQQVAPNLNEVLSGQLGQMPQASPGDIGQALGAATKAFIPGVTKGAVAGAIGGTAIAPGPGTAIGAVAVGALGGVGGAIMAFINNLKQQRKEDITASAVTLPKRQRNALAYVTDVNQGGSVSDDVERFNLELSAIDKDYAQLQLDSKSKFLGEDATVELATYEMFYEPGGTRDRLIYEMQQAILNPNPSKNLISISDVTA